MGPAPHLCNDVAPLLRGKAPDEHRHVILRAHRQPKLGLQLQLGVALGGEGLRVHRW